METCDPIGTPMEIKDKLDLDKHGTLVDATKYRRIIGALMYLTSSRPDIVHTTCLCARYQAQPTEKHLKEVKRIFRYLRGTVNMGLWYTKDSGFELTGFLDADYAGCRDSFKSTFGATQFLGEKLVGWSKKRLYGAVIHRSRICVFIRLMCPTIAISCNPVQHSRTKHIAVRYHFIKEHVEKGTIELYFVKTDYQLADLFTKALPVDRFNYLVRRLGMRSLSPQELERLAKSHSANEKHLKEVNSDLYVISGEPSKGLCENLVGWSSKKQDCTALSSAKAEYVSLSACSMAISYNPVQHTRTKHIAVRYHFIKEDAEKGTIELYFVKTDYQLANLFIKSLPMDRFNYLVLRLGMRSLSPHELERLAKSQ
ncbi:hypothetical protein Tco_0919217 [Tanacetum coccineum]